MTRQDVYAALVPIAPITQLTPPPAWWEADYWACWAVAEQADPRDEELLARFRAGWDELAGISRAQHSPVSRHHAPQ